MVTRRASQPRSLWKRRLDILYLVYFAIHLFASLAIDAQLTYPPFSQRLFPKPVQTVLKDYLVASKDPFLLAALAKSPAHVWFRALLSSETFLQVPCFLVGIWGLWKDEKRVYPILVAYGTLAASSTFQCICSLLFGNDGQGLDPAQIWGLLQNYVPFCAIPALLTVDMTRRIVRLLDPDAGTHVGGGTSNKTD